VQVASCSQGRGLHPVEVLSVKNREFAAFVAPSMIALLAFTIIPLAVAFSLSLESFEYWTMNARVFVGLRNYRDILADARFLQAVSFTLLIMVIVTPIEILLGSFIALLLDQLPKRRRGLFIALALTTYVSVPVVASYMFRGLFYTGGLGNWLYQLLTGKSLALNETSVKLLIIIYQLWRDTPFVILVVFAGLQSLPEELLDAAAIDGAGRLKQLRYVAIPHLAPLLILIAMTILVALYAIFDPIYVITGMNPVFHADSVMAYNWRTATQYNQLGKANAMALLTLIGAMVLRFPFLYRTWRSQTEER
jgi:N,N'-diacetylchitobiose transport system permease protein